MALFLLFESASGYALFEVTEADELGQTSDTVQVRDNIPPSFTPGGGRVSAPTAPTPRRLLAHPTASRLQSSAQRPAQPHLPLHSLSPAADALSLSLRIWRQAIAKDLARFSKAVKFIAFKPFTNAADALEQVRQCVRPPIWSLSAPA